MSHKGNMLFFFSSFKFNYHQEQSDSKGIIIIITRCAQDEGAQWPNGGIFCSYSSPFFSFISYFLFSTDWQDNGAGHFEGGREKWRSPNRLSFIVYRIITYWWKLRSSRDVSSWRSRSKQLKGRWKFSFKNTHSCLKNIDLAPPPSTSKAIPLIDSGRNTLFSCHRHPQWITVKNILRLRRVGEWGLLRAWCAVFEITIQSVASAAHQSCAF